MDKDHMEIRLEYMNGKFGLVLEGHDVLRWEIRDAGDRSDQKHERTAFLLKALNDKIDAVATDLSAHRRDTEAHGAKWQVREKDE
jgi:hypothetical protein